MENAYPIIELVHETSHWVSILQSGFLMSGAERDTAEIFDVEGMTGGDWREGGQFVGIYMGLITKNMIGENKKYWLDNSVSLVFSTSELLQREDYHINEFDNNGILTKHSWSRKNLGQFLQGIQRGKIELDLPEVIFHNKVNMNNLLYIDCKSSDYEHTYRTMQENGLEKWLGYLRRADTILFKYLEPMVYHNPRFCNVQTYLDENNKKQNNSASVYEQIAMNCGMTETDLIDFLYKNCRSKYPEKCLQKLRMYLFDEYEIPIILGIKGEPPTVYYPPFDENTISEILKHANEELRLNSAQY